MDRYNFYRPNGTPPGNKSFLSYLIVGVIGAVIGGMLVLMFAPAALLGRVVPQENVRQSETQKEEQKPEVVQKIEINSITSIAKTMMPTVVGIRTTKFKESMFFGRQKVEGVGSGVIVDKKGYIVTNNHVADDRVSDITVSLADGRNVKGRVVWTDSGLDLSVVKIEADNLSVAQMGDSDAIQVGEIAIAIGNPLGLRFERSVTSGIISALNRTIPMDENKFMEDLIQTDASINNGNSGGPLINGQGKVIGINTIKVTSAEGMGFAIPINIVTPVVKSLVETGKFKTPYIGITGLDKEIANFYDYKIDKGIYVVEIDKKGPAYKAGIRKDDIILEIGGTPVNTMTSLKQAIFKAGVGSEIKIKYQDKFQNQKTITAKLEEAF